MKLTRIFGAVLALCFLAAPVFALTLNTAVQPVHHISLGVKILVGLAALAGTVTVQYLAFPGFTAGTVAPTAAQMANRTILNAQVGAGSDADTTGTLTHNWGFSAADTASGYPLISIIPEPGGTAFAGWSISARAANSLTLTKQSTVTGSGGTYTFQLLRYAPSSVTGRT
jgi:hypothetical protein